MKSELKQFREIGARKLRALVPELPCKPRILCDKARLLFAAVVVVTSVVVGDGG